MAISVPPEPTHSRRRRTPYPSHTTAGSAAISFAIGSSGGQRFQVLEQVGVPANGSVVTIFWTGGGQTVPAGISGKIETQGLPQPAQPVSVTIDNRPAELVWAGAVPNSWAGLLMARMVVPDGAGTSGPVPVVIKVGQIASPSGTATMRVQ